MAEYIKSDRDVTYEGDVIFTADEVVKGIKMANEALLRLNDSTKEFDINIFEVLGMRNLSGLVGEYVGKCLLRVSGGKLSPNLHQDGYPDLLLTNSDETKHYYNSLYSVKGGKVYPVSKDFFSPYKYGGIEVKASCGNTPSAKKVPKPLIGEQRVSLITGFDWKAHHRHTNHLMAIVWDFIDENPTIVAAFYHDGLVEDDWGRLIEPKEEGGRTTSVSIMRSVGVKKMCRNWIAVIDDDAYIDKLSNKRWIGYRVGRERNLSLF